MHARQPSLFIPHGAGPCFFMDWSPAHTWHAMGAYLQSIAGTLPEPPRAILVISAHWLAEDFCLTSHPQPELIFDYYGFPEHTYALQYPAPGSPQLARQAQECLTAAGLTASLDPNRGLDHGVFIPLLLMFPQAQIPVVQLSLRHDLDPVSHRKAGEALASLRDQGVLILGSGMSFHNMRGYGDPQFGPISERFDQWLSSTVSGHTDTRAQALDNWTQAPEAGLCHPPRQEEHLLPLMVVAGAAANERGQKTFSDVALETRLSAFQFG